MQQAPLAVAVGGRRSSPGPGGTSGFVPQPGRMLGGTTPKFVLNCRMHQLRRRAAPLPLAGSQATKDYSKRGTSSSERARARPERRPQPLSFGAAWQLSRRWRRPWSRSLDDLLAAVGADDAIKRYIAARRITTTTHIIHPFIAGTRIDGTDHGLSRRPEEGHHDAPLCRGLTPVDGGGRGRGGLVGAAPAAAEASMPDRRKPLRRGTTRSTSTRSGASTVRRGSSRPTSSSAEEVLARMWFEHTTVTVGEIVSRCTWTTTRIWPCRERRRRPTPKHCDWTWSTAPSCRRSRRTGCPRASF